MNETLDALIRQLDLEPLEVNLFRGQSRHMGGPRVFGGQVIGQALVAAECSPRRNDVVAGEGREAGLQV